MTAYQQYQALTLHQRIWLYRDTVVLLRQEHKRDPLVYEVILTMAALATDNIKDISSLTRDIERMRAEYALEADIKAMKNNSN